MKVTKFLDEKRFRVPASKLRTKCDLSRFKFRSTKNLDILNTIIGQDKAVEAIKFGLGIRNQGYNIFVTGLTGTGKTSVIKSFLEEIVHREKTPGDWCYVYNFNDPDFPKSIFFPTGEGSKFKESIRRVFAEITAGIPKAMKTRDYQDTVKSFLAENENAKNKLLKQLHRKARQKGCKIEFSEGGINIIPLTGDRPMSELEMTSLPENKRQQVIAVVRVLQADVERAISRTREIENTIKEKLNALQQATAANAVEQLMKSVKKKYKTQSEVLDYLDQFQADIVTNLEDFVEETELKNVSELSEEELEHLRYKFAKYKVNLLVDNSRTKGSPVVTEPNPTYHNLFGRIERKPRSGGYVSDFTMIKSGSVHRANGGFLVINATDALVNWHVWDSLKRTIKTKEVRIEDIEHRDGSIPVASMRPAPIPADLKIIIIGSDYVYHMLYNDDEDFKKIFKVKAEFDHEMSRSEERVMDYAKFVGNRCRAENLKHFDKSGVGSLVDFSSRIVEHQHKLSARFSEITDIIREASFWATKSRSALVQAKHVERAIETRVSRSNLQEDKLQEFISRNDIMIDVKGKIVGQVNGLSVYDWGDYSFGKPFKITVNTYLDSSGIFDIEREADLSGRIYNKGSMILSSCFSRRFGQDKVLNLRANIAIEQSYGEIEGDSATAAELYALLSSLAGVPIDQGLAVTGSVNQQGLVQPIGGVNEKIEGFFNVCKARKLTGRQGVIVPFQNMKNLMLKPEIVEAVRKKRFHIYAVQNIDEGIQILTGRRAGKLRRIGGFEEGTINYLVNKKLTEFNKKINGDDRPRRDTKSPKEKKHRKRAAQIETRGRKE